MRRQALVDRYVRDADRIAQRHVVRPFRPARRAAVRQHLVDVRHHAGGETDQAVRDLVGRCGHVADFGALAVVHRVAVGGQVVHDEGAADAFLPEQPGQLGALLPFGGMREQAGGQQQQREQTAHRRSWSG